ncbi:class I SAM-dependent methyltransferase [Rhizobium sp. A37_96]
MKQFQTALDGYSLVTAQSISEHARSSGNILTTDQIKEGEAELALILSLTQQGFEANAPVQGIMKALTERLQALMNKSTPLVWTHLASIAQAHPVSSYLLQDPLTRWSFEKPRGYSGDAYLLDFIYEHPAVAAQVKAASPLGSEIYNFTRSAPSAVAVRERRDLLAAHVDAVAGENDNAEILAIAAGHLREAERSQALQSGKLKRWVALDQDPISVGTVSSAFHGSCVEAVNGSVRTILGRAQKLGTFDFIYAAGLYDYLAESVAVRLTERCLQMLKPGGKFLLANFAKDIGVEGYMETFMNWPLIWRTDEDVQSIIDKVRHHLADISVTRGENGGVIYAVLTV